MDELTEEVERSRSGDAAAFAAIVRRFQDRAVAYAAGQLGRLGVAEDAAQEAFLEAWLNLPRLREPRAFATWFRRILFKQCDRIRRRREFRTLPLEAAGERGGAGEDPRETMNGVERGACLEDALGRLPPRLRTALLLHYAGDLSLAEMAAFLDIPVSSVKKRLYDGRQRLRTLLVREAGDVLRAARPSRGRRFQERVLDLHSAARAGDEPRVRALLGCEPRLATARDPLGNTALIVAVNGGRRAVARLLLQAGVRPGFHESAAIGWPRRVGRWLERHPGQVDLESAEGMTALGYAAHFGHLSVVEVLLGAGADPDRPVAHPLRVTPLHAALFGGRSEVAARLLEWGADPNRARGATGSPRDGWTGLHYAAAFGDPALLALVLDRGGDPGIPDAAGRIPREIALEQAHGPIALILDHHATGKRKEIP